MREIPCIIGLTQQMLSLPITSYKSGVSGLLRSTLKASGPSPFERSFQGYKFLDIFLFLYKDGPK